MQQIPLPVRLKSALTFDSFVVGVNSALVESLRQRAKHAFQAPFWVWSVGGAGRSHVLQALCHQASAGGFRCMYLPLAEAWVEPAMLEGLEQLNLICLDDVDARLGDELWEKALFRLYVMALDKGVNLVLSAGAPPAGLTIHLKDLLSRYQASEIWQLHSLPEADQAQALTLRAQQLGLQLTAPVQTYLRLHAPRDLSALCQLLDELDTKALVEKRPITVALCRALLND